MSRSSGRSGADRRSRAKHPNGENNAHRAGAHRTQARDTAYPGFSLQFDDERRAFRRETVRRALDAKPRFSWRSRLRSARRTGGLEPLVATRGRPSSPTSDITQRDSSGRCIVAAETPIRATGPRPGSAGAQYATYDSPGPSPPARRRDAGVGTRYGRNELDVVSRALALVLGICSLHRCWHWPSAGSARCSAAATRAPTHRRRRRSHPSRASAPASAGDRTTGCVRPVAVPTPRSRGTARSPPCTAGAPSPAPPPSRRRSSCAGSARLRRR
jgi:hypothetical protein